MLYEQAITAKTWHSYRSSICFIKLGQDSLLRHEGFITVCLNSMFNVGFFLPTAFFGAATRK